MKIIFKILIIVFTFLIISCSGENPVEPTLNYDQDLIFAQLSQYKFEATNYYVEFFPDSSFIQMQYRENSENGEMVQLYKRIGKYKIESNLIVLSNIKVDYDTSLGMISIIWSDLEVYLKDGKITFDPVSVLQADNYKTDLWNYWKTIKWVYHYSDIVHKIYDGREEYFYEFVSSSDKVKWGYDFLDGNPWPGSEYESTYTYNPPELYLGNMSEKYQVVFKNEKMYWYFKSSLNKKEINNISNTPLFPETINFK